MYPKDMLKLILTILLFLLFPLKLSHAQIVEKVTINYMEATANDDIGGVDVSGYVFVSDADNNPVDGLNKESFIVTQDGQPIEIESVELAKDPITVIIVIDTSGSMDAKVKDDRTALDFAKDAAVEFIDGLRPEDQVAIYSFSSKDKGNLHHDLTTNHESAKSAVQSINLGEYGTCLYDASMEAIKRSAEVTKGRRAIIVLTDGRDSTEKVDTSCNISSHDDVIDKAIKPTSRVPLFTVGFGKVNESVLKKMATETGGRSLIAPEATELDNLFNSISNQLKNQYLIKYHTEVASDEHSVVVRVGEELDESGVFIPASKTPVDTPDTSPIQEEVSFLEQYGLFVGIGAILLIIIIGLIMFFASRKEKEEEYPEYDYDETEFISQDTMMGTGVDPFRTMDDHVTATSGGHQMAMSSARLDVIEGMNVVSGDSFPITNNPTTIGRNEGGIINDIDIPDKPISRRHAEISQSGGRFTIRDKGSRYGTTVNGQDVSSIDREINNGDIIGIGTRTKLRFVVSSSGGATQDPFATMDSGSGDPFATMDTGDDPFRTMDEV